MRSSLEPLLLVALLSGCGAAGGPEATVTNAETPDAGAPVTVAWASLDERPCPPDSTLTWNNFGGPMVLTWCTGCHGSGLLGSERAGAPTGMDFESRSLVTQHAARIWARAADANQTMPPRGLVPDDDRRRLGEWLACGAP